MDRGSWHCKETGIKTIPKKKKCKKAKWLFEEALQIAVKRREVKSKGEKERYKHVNAEFQRIARRDKKAFHSDQCKEIEENNRMWKTRDLFKKIRVLKARILKWFAIPFSSGPHSVRPLHHDHLPHPTPPPPRLVWSHRTWLSFIELDKAVVRVIILNIFCYGFYYGFSVAALCWSNHEEIPHVQGKRNPSKTVGVARGHQRADTLKP